MLVLVFCCSVWVVCFVDWVCCVWCVMVGFYYWMWGIGIVVLLYMGFGWLSWGLLLDWFWFWCWLVYGLVGLCVWGWFVCLSVLLFGCMNVLVYWLGVLCCGCGCWCCWGFSCGRGWVVLLLVNYWFSWLVNSG